MHLDLPTLFVVSVFLVILIGGLLLFTWARDRRVPSLAWWGFGHLIAAPGLLLLALRGTISDLWSVAVASLLLIIVAALCWGGARRFERRETRLLVIAAPSVPWLLAAAVPGFYETATFGPRIALFSTIIAAYALLAAWELWRGRSEPLLSRWPAIALLVGHAGWFAARAIGGVLAAAGLSGAVLAYGWIVLTGFEIMVFGVALAFLVLSMTREREEVRYRAAASIDPLTGAANRRAFAEGVASIHRDPRRPDGSVAYLLFDLDHFKKINDTQGHLLGDQVLRLFATLARDGLRAQDLFGRIGGEEFAAVLLNVSQAGALATAERIRNQFEQAGRIVAGRLVGATVSIGVAVRRHHPDDFEALFGEADAALYLAKSAGRNCVRMLDPGSTLPAAEPRKAAATAPRRSNTAAA